MRCAANRRASPRWRGWCTTRRPAIRFSYANYLAELGADAQSKIYEKSSVDLAMRDAFRKMRHFLMTTRGLNEDEAISLMSVAVDFGVTQVVDGNWGVHAVIRKQVVAGA